MRKREVKVRAGAARTRAALAALKVERMFYPGPAKSGSNPFHAVRAVDNPGRSAGVIRSDGRARSVKRVRESS